jgi:hypothetical protein
MASKALHAAWRMLYIFYILWCWMDMHEDQSSGVVAHALTSEKPKKAKFRDLQKTAMLIFLSSMAKGLSGALRL